MSFLVSHPTGNTFVKALVEELNRNNLLELFYTTIGFGEECNMLFSKLKARRGYKIPDNKINRYWNAELRRLLRNANQEQNRRDADLVYSKLDYQTSKRIPVHTAKVIHAYEDGAVQTFNRAKDLGIQCSYELPIVHWSTSRRLLAEEAERYPQWEPTLESTREPEDKLYQKEEELRLANRITCPSKFVLDSIPIEIRKSTPCQIAPFGSPPSCTNFSFYKRKKQHFKILFVGSMGQRKGLADLFEAMKLLKTEPVKLSILGKPSMPMEFYRLEYPDFTYFPPCSNEKVREIMCSHDAIVLPSIVEGRALVQQEALSCGLPLIATANAGGEDLIDEGITGYLIPIRSPHEIAEKIIHLMNNKISNRDIQLACIKKAKTYSWINYARKIIDFNLN